MAAAETSWSSFARLCDSLAATRSKLVKRAAMAEYLRLLDVQRAGLAAQYLTGAAFPETDERKLQVGGRLAAAALETVAQVNPEKLHAVYRKHGDLGATGEELLLAVGQVSLGLEMVEISARLDALAAARTQIAKSAQLVDALRSMSPVEAKYFLKLLLSDMRMGVQQSLAEEAIAVAAQEELPAVRHAVTLLGSLPAVVELAWRHALSTARFRMFHPLGFMLATPAGSVEEAYARFAANSLASKTAAQIEPSAHVEDKYDGMRAQIHCGDPQQPGRVRIFSRTREDVTSSFPELAEWFAGIDTPAILDGEILAWDFEEDRALPFTALQQRLGRKRVTAAMQTETPVVYMAFDLLLAGDELLLNTSLRERRSHLEVFANMALQSRSWRLAVRIDTQAQASLFETNEVTNAENVQPRLKLAPAIHVISAAELEETFAAARARGNEGLMVKSLDSTYQPGRRGSAWLKIKRELATLDVVVTAVEYGHGRRAGVLSDYTFAVRDGATLRNVGKAYSGLTDEEIRTLTAWFLEHTLDTSRGRLIVEPKIVLEVAFNNVMQSERHDSGYSLRFPRILRIRMDKPVEEIDTLDRVAEIFRSQAIVHETI